ncbi:Electron transfer flavoprotein alpha subunit [Acidimicrobium ferrooxidans DSM 10331]|uniref:Electron transfer flavoprotein alpha subunit n=1 Tax=Acidimicrobium ferrooxidans (strain DSM 10331 / JCM 15462 / NBRC 103882 / ICP) TaxID=525909 RepID=C7LYV1_ACIFD|nr:electron transfer flavoprotein subunit alpha/FixB family protein [Acidimicrobium ferrooxidans]ACU53909.1 Electron transfer flavoprotein alpha subunit [Acidimicrobium ferrooxidans DSM 10331]
MSVAVLVVSERVVGEVPDVTFELLGKGREIASALGGELAIAVLGHQVGELPFGAADVAYVVDDPALANYAASAVEAALAAVVEAASPKVVLMSTGTVGLDLAASLAARLGAPMASYAVDVATEGDTVVATSQLYGGKLLAEVALEGSPAVVSVIPGSFAADAGRVGGAPRIETIAVSLDGAGARGEGVREPEASGVDITAADLLVSVGRGIGSKENLELVQELADALKVPLAASRPIIDQGWLPKPHQVGKSGKKVKPQVYLALGISGAPEHLEGMRSAGTIIACNTDPKAPIFEVAHYGTTVDLFDLVPELTERL